MNEDLLRFPEAQEFLSDYPKAKWKICIESVFVYGLYSIKRDFPNGLSIPELMQIAGYDSSKLKSTGFSNLESWPRRNEETQTLFRSQKQQIAEEDVKKLKTSGSQTLISTNKSFNKSKEFIGEVSKLEDFTISEKIREPRICSIENAKKIMKKAPDQGRLHGAVKKDRSFAFNFNVDFLPKTIPADMYKKERTLLTSPKFYS